MQLRVATRASALALWQANWVASHLRGFGATVELVEITTGGDKNQSSSLSELGIQGAFTKEVQIAVLGGSADVAVHSLKDLPTEPLDGLIIAAIPARASCSDVLITSSGKALSELPSGARVGTGSLRRQAQLLLLRSDLAILPIRGNVDSRLRKLAAGEFDALVLAAAGLDRLGLVDQVTEELAPPRMLPAPGQGALAIECRRRDAELRSLLRRLDDPATRAATDGERMMLSKLHAGCSAPVGAWGRIENGALHLDGLVASPDGRLHLTASATGPLANASSLGRNVADQLLAQGAHEIILQSRTA